MFSNWAILPGLEAIYYTPTYVLRSLRCEFHDDILGLLMDFIGVFGCLIYGYKDESGGVN